MGGGSIRTIDRRAVSWERGWCLPREVRRQNASGRMGGLCSLSWGRGLRESTPAGGQSHRKVTDEGHGNAKGTEFWEPAAHDRTISLESSSGDIFMSE